MRRDRTTVLVGQVPGAGGGAGGGCSYAGPGAREVVSALATRLAERLSNA